MGTVESTSTLTPSGRSITVSLPGWPGNIAGQHVDVRLTAPDGYQAVRSYSIASVGPAELVELAVDKLPTGEVSPYLVDDVQPGDMLELRGPLGGWFVWKPEQTGPVQLIAGGSGVVPLVSMVRSHTASGSDAPFRMLYSVRTPDDVFYREELAGSGVQVDYVYTRAVPAGWPTGPGRLTKDRLAASVFPVSETPAFFVCGPTAFVEAVATWLVELGYPAETIKTERFGG
ncbi:ferredoxin reductase [Antiquaquibacter oligotrophicus]|uniref:ferredoxin reductase n=1 Tax=Antiquaquibacter oligotrophicus TaxID=2880260 RepID=UPI002AC93CA1|nr:ferredoxin reductase [Antiquaquibacter oligotrophicus]UDF12769.1 ferredoxin reductase [Antiquaquibacter oligotrophicus]